MPREPFLNPYTFVPAFPRDGLPEAFADAAPPGTTGSTRTAGRGRSR
ncbi:hypothetical protein [Actinomadura sp. CNU-125]|nr:hypothetical protein [Actinomadura sp. CNU-125]